jgi:predicted phage tail protein
MNANAPLTPFAMPQYRLAARKEAGKLELEAETWAAKASTNVQRATNYVLGAVLFAAALFFAGMSAKLRTQRLRTVLLSFGLVVFLGTVAWIATFPISISI